MKKLTIVLLFVVGLLLGGIIGYAWGTDDMKEEAVANGAAVYSKIDLGMDGHNTKIKFSWLRRQY